VEEALKRALLTSLAAASLAGAAFAADLPRGPVPYYSNTPVATGFSWTGWYLGGNVGYEWANVPGSSANLKGVTGGLQGGYNWQWGQFVLGGETDLQLTGAADTFAP
jgi:outer membrane immunogenic protein